jgi:hypothetical protein
MVRIRDDIVMRITANPLRCRQQTQKPQTPTLSKPHNQTRGRNVPINQIKRSHDVAHSTRPLFTIRSPRTSIRCLSPCIRISHHIRESNIRYFWRDIRSDEECPCHEFDDHYLLALRVYVKGGGTYCEMFGTEKVVFVFDDADFSYDYDPHDSTKSETSLQLISRDTGVRQRG